MLFFVIMALVVSAYVEDTDWSRVAAPPWWSPVLQMAAAVAVAWLLSWLLARRTTRPTSPSPFQGEGGGDGRDRSGLSPHPLLSPRGRGAFLRRAAFHHRLLWGLRGLMLGLYLWLVFGADWPAVVYRTLGLGNWVVVDNWAVVAPFVAMLVAHWAPLYRVDILLRRRQASSMPAQPLSGVPLDPFRPWSRGQYLSHHLRHSVLVVMVPVSLWWAGMDGLRWGLSGLGVGDEWHLLPALVWVLGIYAVSPLLMRVIWNTRRLPEGPLRERLRRLCRRTGLRYRDILVWRTRCDIVNAAVAGVVGQLRFIFLTDGLLRHLNPEQIEAVFAHEAGHVRHRHIPSYLVFAAGSMVFVLTLYETADLVNGALGGSRQLARALTEGWPFLLVALGLYWGMLFGYLSRRFERQADVFAVRAVSGDGADGNGTWPPGPPVTEVEDGASGIRRQASVWTQDRSLTPDARRPMPDARSLDPLAVGRFARALEAVGELNGMMRNVPGWTHFSIGRRVWFLEQALVAPHVERRFQRRLTRLKWAWLAAAVLGLAFLAWRHLAEVRDAAPGDAPRVTAASDVPRALPPDR